MKKNKALLNLIVLLSTSVCLAFGLNVQGPVEKKDFSVRSFNSLNVQTQYNVYLSQGNNESVTVETYKSIMPYIQVKQRGNVLTISLDRKLRNIRWLNRDKILNVYINVKDLENIDLSGACDLYMQSDLNVRTLKISSSGAGDLFLKKITAGEIRVLASGASDIRQGDFSANKRIYINTSGACDVDISMRSPEVEIIASGASDFNMQVNAQLLKINTSGSSDFYVRGETEILKASISGRSLLHALELKTVRADVETSGASESKVNVSGSLKASSSGTASIYYTGNPGETSIRVSGISSIKGSK